MDITEGLDLKYTCGSEDDEDGDDEAGTSSQRHNSDVTSRHNSDVTSRHNSDESIPVAHKDSFCSMSTTTASKYSNSLKTIPLRLTQACIVNKPFYLHTSDKYPRHLINTLDSIRRSDQLCDVVIRVAEKTFNAHKLILAACCPYFRAMFTQVQFN